MLYSRTSCLNAAVRRLNTLAAEVERLTAELTAHRTDTLRLHDEMRAHHAAELALAAGFAREEIAALRARLDAAGEWRAVGEAYISGPVQIIKNARMTNGYFFSEGGGLLDEERIVAWRPAPRQE